MATASTAWTQETIELAGARIEMRKGGAGAPLLLLHDELGHSAWLRFHQELAQDYTLYVPSHPGYGESEGLEWVMNMRDLAGWYLEALDDLELGPVSIMGFSIGGWLAAEMAAMCPQQFNKLVLVGATGVKPPTGEIYDMFQVMAKNYITTGVLNPDQTAEFPVICPESPSPEMVESWEVAREESCRLSWRPYMHYHGLPHLLHRLKRLPTLIVWGRQDPIVPLSAGQLYHEAIPGSRLSVLDDCGHRPEIEKTDEFVGLVRGFLSGD